MFYKIWLYDRIKLTKCLERNLKNNVIVVSMRFLIYDKSEIDHFIMEATRIVPPVSFNPGSQPERGFCSS